MVRWFLAVLVLVSGCAAKESQREDVAAPQLRAIQIVVNGGYSGAISGPETESHCADFLLTRSKVTAYFERARSVTESEYQHELTPSNCFASGTAATVGGERVEWKVDRARRGLITFSEGKTFHFYSPLSDALYYEACDISCIHE
jgi:hypothetical protein